MKIVVLDGYVLNPGDLSWSNLASLGELIVYDRTKPGDVIERIADAEIIYTNKTVINEEIITACPNLKFIGVLATGYNVVDIVAAKKNKIVVTNIPDYGTTAVAQFTFGLILELCHRIGLHSDSVKHGKWSNNSDFSYCLTPQTELKDKILGIIGFGKIGKAVLKIAQAFGLKVVISTAYPQEQYLNENVKFVTTTELIKISDIISLHCPLTTQNEKLINKDRIKEMKDGVMIINTARGGLIDEKALAEGLATRKVLGAALDVVSAEPISSNNPLLKAPNCIITPHIAWAPKEARQRLMDIAVLNLGKYLEQTPINIVN